LKEEKKIKSSAYRLNHLTGLLHSIPF